MLRDGRPAITQVQGVVVAVVVLTAVGGGVYFLGGGHSQSSQSTGPVDLSIVESDPVNQVDSFNPANITVSHGATITLAVQNGDDEPRTFEISAFNVNQTISAGATTRIMLNLQQPGTFKMFVPGTLPSAVNGAKASPSITGYLIVT